MTAYKESVGLCPECAQDSAARYEERADGMWLILECPEHGRADEKVENDAAFFRWGYEQEYAHAYSHLVLPVTYRCNLSCKYCYTLSNADFDLPGDRPFEEMAKIIDGFDGNVTLIGGEPTVRGDIMDLIRRAKARRRRKVSLGTNGQKLKDIAFVKALQEAGLDFVFLSLNDELYDGPAVRQNKLRTLVNCFELDMPVWLHQTVESLSQVDSLLPVLQEYKKVVFSVTLRAVKPFGLLYPEDEIFGSDIIKYLGKADDYGPGFNFFNREIRLEGISVKVCSWVNDVVRCDAVDSRYLISNGTITGFHRGMKVDEVLLKGAGALVSRAT